MNNIIRLTSCTSITVVIKPLTSKLSQKEENREHTLGDHLEVHRRRDEHDERRELAAAQDLQCLRLDVQYGHVARGDQITNSAQLRAVHGVLVSAELEVLVLRHFLQHLRERHEVVLPPVRLVSTWRSRSV